MAVIGIIVFCGVIIGATAWLLNRPGHPKDPREDDEQMEYLREWNRKHKKIANTERSQPPAGAKEKNEKYQRKQFYEKSFDYGCGRGVFAVAI